MFQDLVNDEDSAPTINKNEDTARSRNNRDDNPDIYTADIGRHDGVINLNIPISPPSVSRIPNWNSDSKSTL